MGDGAAYGRRVSFDLDEIADRCLVEGDDAILETPFLSAFLVAEAPRETEPSQNRLDLRGVRDDSFSFLPPLDASFEASWPLEGEKSLAIGLAQPQSGSRRGELSCRVVEE